MRLEGPRAWLFVCCLALSTAISCSEPPRVEGVQEDQPNVLWIVWDTVRADRLGMYGYDRDTTPALDAFFARQGRVYDRALSTAPWTLPSHAAMFTGHFPVSSGANHDSRWLDDDFETLAEHLSRQGYSTYLVSANPNVSTETNLTQGFAQQAHPWTENPTAGPAEQPPRATRGLQRENRSAELTEQLLQWLDGAPASEPFFAYVNLMDAHWPRRLSDDEVETLKPRQRLAYQKILNNQQERRMAYTFGCREYPRRVLKMMNLVYDANIEKLDRITGLLLETLKERGQLEKTLVIFTSDHGENLGDHHLLGHEFSVHETLLRVPLAIRYPKRFPPGRVNRPVQTSDLYRTVLDVAGVEVPPVAGESSFSLADGERGVPGDRLLVSEYLVPKRQVEKQLVRAGCEGFQFEGLRAVERNGLKTILGDLGTRELYRPETDRGEQDDLSAMQPDDLAILEADLQTWLADLTRYHSRDPTPELTEEGRSELEALGYL